MWQVGGGGGGFMIVNIIIVVVVYTTKTAPIMRYFVCVVGCFVVWFSGFLFLSFS